MEKQTQIISAAQSQLQTQTQTQVCPLRTANDWLNVWQAQSSEPMWLHSQCKSIKTMEQAMVSETPTIADMAREGGEDVTQALIEVELLKLNQRLNLRHPLTEFDVEFIAEELKSGINRSLKLAEISLILDDICRGKYGELYERISAAKILSAVRDYWEERQNVSVTQTLKQHETFSDETVRRKSDLMMSLIKKVRNK